MSTDDRFATLADEDIETRTTGIGTPGSAAHDDSTDVADTGDDSGDVGDTSDTGDDTGDTGDVGDDAAA